jgi:hypothetical protein
MVLYILVFGVLERRPEDKKHCGQNRSSTLRIYVSDNKIRYSSVGIALG